MKCYGCLEDSKGKSFIKCTSTTCSKKYCSLCINQSALSIDKKSSWKCPECCATQRKGGDNSSTPLRPTEDNITIRNKSSTQTDVCMTSEVKELIEEVRLLTREISSLKTQLENAATSLTICQTRLEELGSSVAANDNRIRHLESREQQTKLLEAKVSELQFELNIQAQQHLSNELELSGIPEQTNENLHHIALLAARKVGIELNDCDIDWVARAGPRRISALSAEHNTKFPRPVVVRLLRRNKRDQIIKASKSRRNITSTDLDAPGSPLKVYYNERLTKVNRLLFRAARATSKEFGYSYCWCTQGKIYVKQNEGKPSHYIRTHNDLQNVFKTSQH